MKRTTQAGALLLGAFLSYLLAWPTGMQPVAWTPPAAPALTGVYAANDKLKSIQQLAPGYGKGPEAINVDSAGRIYTGYADGRVVVFSQDGATPTELVNTQGRPLGIAFAPGVGIVIADAKKGLLHF